MNPNQASLRWVTIVGAALLLVALGVRWFQARVEPPTAQELELLPIVSQVGSFGLTNQLGAGVNETALDGSVWVANIIFTRCPGPCVQMSRILERLQGDFANEPGLRFLSLTADPAFDTPDVLRSYGRRFEARAERWWFATGPKAQVYRLAIQDLKLAVVENPQEGRSAPDDLFVHSTQFVLLDRARRVRGVYESTEPEAVARLRRDVRRLLEERS